MDKLRGVLGQDEHSGLRAFGGLLLAIGVLVVLFRRTGPFVDEPWGSLPIFLIFLVTTAFLYGSAVFGARFAGRALGWQALYAVIGVVFVPLTLYSFLDWVGGNTDAPLNTAWIFLLTAIAGFAAALIARVRAGSLLGGFALIIAWLALWGELLEGGVGADIGTLRGLLVLIAGLLLVLAAILGASGRSEGGPTDLITAAGFAAMLAGAISLIALSDDFFSFFFGAPEISASLFWDLELFGVTLALLLYGAASGARGPVYVGVIGLVAFVLVVGYDADDASPEGSLLGWPLILLLGAVAALAASVIGALRRGRS